jgi:hypothetical protein
MVSSGNDDEFKAIAVQKEEIAHVSMILTG